MDYPGRQNESGQGTPRAAQQTGSGDAGRRPDDKRRRRAVFPAPRSGKAMTDMTLTALLRRFSIPAVPHGFRSSFRNWAAEQSGASWAVCESALAHNVGNSTEAAYMRSDLFEQRRALTQEWADFACQQRVVAR